MKGLPDLEELGVIVSVDYVDPVGLGGPSLPQGLAEGAGGDEEDERL